MRKNNVVKCCIVSSSVLSTCLYNYACGSSKPDPSNEKQYIVKALGIKESDILKIYDQIEFTRKNVHNDMTNNFSICKDEDYFFVVYEYYKKNAKGFHDEKVSFVVIKGDMSKVSINSSVIKEVQVKELMNDDMDKRGTFVILVMFKREQLWDFFQKNKDPKCVLTIHLAPDAKFYTSV